MSRYQRTTSAPVIYLSILFSLLIIPSSSNPVTEDKSKVSANYAALSTKQPTEFVQEAEERSAKISKNEDDDELFKDVDPRTLAAVLLEALNKPQIEKLREDEGTQVERDVQGVDRDRNGHEELELVKAAAATQGKEEPEREEEEEKKRAEEEDRLTEKVTSRTTSQIVPMKEPDTRPGVAEREEMTKEENRKPEQEDLGEEEQLSPEEVKNLENMMEEFQSYSAATKRERDANTYQRESRGEYFDYLDRNGLMNNEIKPKAKSNDLALPKKKIKWQLEQEKNKIQPLQRGGNFMDDFNNNDFADPEENTEEDQEDEEMLSPEEEESRAKAEQEEVRRQAAEAQRAKAEEEKLADIASDMLLKYIGKQDKKKYQDSNGAEDKRSDEEDASQEEDDDIDPQTIDKLIEISSKLHLPADDVVDIINDVEKKKKKDAPENLQWQRPLVPPPGPAASTTLLRKPPTPNAPVPNTSPLKAWFKDRTALRPSQDDPWTRQWPIRTYPSYQRYQQPYRGYYPVYITPPKAKPHYYSKPAYSLNDVLGNALDYDFDYSPRHKSRPWARPRQRVQPAFQRNFYFPPPRTFKPKPRVPPRLWPSFYYPAQAPVVTRQNDYYRKSPQESEEQLENFVERVFMKHPRMFQ